MDTKISLPKYKPWGAKFKNNKLIEQIRHDDAYLVTKYSPMKDKKIVYRFAQYFRREFRYDFVQFCEKEDDEYEAYIFTEYDDAIGACCFRKRENKEDSWWALQWIWLHPYFRDRGVLSKHWKFFESRYEIFDVERPLSNAMKQVLLRLRND